MGYHAPPDDGAESIEQHALHDLGFFGHYLHVHHGGRSGQSHILVKIHRNGGHMMQSVLQEQSTISSGSMSEVLAKLEASGYVTREKSEEDRRTFDIALTQEGEEHVATILARRREFEQACLACLTQEEKEGLVSLLDRLADHWRELEKREGCA